MSDRPREVRRPVAIDLFCGAGGLSLGLESAGFDVVCSSDYDPVHAATHEFNFPKTKMLCGDISRLQGEDLLSGAAEGAEAHENSHWEGRVDLVAGGPPCQGFSFIGKRLVDDERNRLVFHFFRVIRELLPRYFVMENVPGMASGGHRGVLEQLIQDFEGIGYRFPEGHWRILNAAEFGVPQDRRRLFLIGAYQGEELVSPPDPTVAPAGGTRLSSENPDPDLPTGPTVWEAIGDLPNLNRYPTLLRSDCVSLGPEVLSRQEELASAYARRLRELDVEKEIRTVPRTWERGVLTASARTSHSEESVRRFRRTKPGEVEPISRFYRLPPSGLCNTLRAGTGSERGAFTSPRPIHPYLPRVLSNREAARLHSLPDWFRPHATKWHGFRQIGNAVAPFVGTAVGRAVIDGLGAEPSRPEQEIQLGDPNLLKMTMKQATAYYRADVTQIPAQRRRGALTQLPAVA